MLQWIKDFLEKKKWKQLKKSDWVVLALLGVLLLIVATPIDKMSSQDSEENTKSKNTVQQEGGVQKSTKQTAKDNADTKETAADTEYVSGLEQKLERILSQMEGVGEVEVMITVSDMGESVIEKDCENTSTVTSESDSAGGNRTVTENSLKEQTIYVETGDETYPYIQKEKLPTIEGVVVVAEGGGNSVVVSNISESVKALLPVEAHRIKVVKMCSKEE